MLFKKLTEIWAVSPRAARSRADAVICAGALALGLAITAASVHADPRSELAQARHELDISEQVLARMTERAAVARSDPAVGPEQLQRLDEQFTRVQELVALNRERVRILSQTVASLPEGAAQVGPQGNKASPAATQAEEIAALEARLGGSLAEFDQLLLEEARRARTRSASSGGGLPGGSGGGGKAASRAGAAGSRGPGAKDGGDGKSDPQQSAGEAGRPRIEGSEPVGTAARPPDVGDGADDDVVARQIRRAAESEPDPALREKLWDEYRKYKQGSKG